MTVHLRRRQFIAAVGAAAACPVAFARAAKLPMIGFLGGATATAQAQWTAAFVQRLRELGWVEGETVAIEYRWADGRFERTPDIIGEFVRLKVDVIVTHATANVLSAKKVTSKIPIVFPSAGDPVANGIVASLARPGGNITGLSVQSPDLAKKSIQLLRDLLPNLGRLATLSNPANPVTALHTAAVKSEGAKAGIDVIEAVIRSATDVEPAIAALTGRAAALIVASDPLFNANRVQIHASILKAMLPTVYLDRVYVQTGGLMSYGPHWPSMWRRAADFVDRILRGAKPADIPVEQPTTFELIINLKTAKALGLTVPTTLLTLADELIE